MNPRRTQLATIAALTFAQLLGVALLCNVGNPGQDKPARHKARAQRASHGGGIGGSGRIAARAEERRAVHGGRDLPLAETR